MEFKNKLNAINHGLAGSGISLRIEQRGQRLNLRGPLPSRSQTGATKTQRISLKLTADQEGLKQAERMLQLVHLQLQRGQFDWSQWAAKPNTPDRKSVV